MANERQEREQKQGDSERTFATVLAERILRGEGITVFTGAGMSTESGLPDFRSPQGLWKDRDPREFATLWALERNPEAFREFYRWRIETLLAVQPNRGHHILAEWERRGIVRCVITQNVDGLHGMAGSRNVIPLHGDLRSLRCSRCRQEYGAELFLKRHECPDCGGALRPNVVLFGENLPERAMEEAEEAAASGGLFLVLGSSLTVSPANWYPRLARASGAFLAIVNAEPTPLDGLAHAVSRRAITEELRAVDALLHDAGSEGGR